MANLIGVALRLIGAKHHNFKINKNNQAPEVWQIATPPKHKKRLPWQYDCMRHFATPWHYVPLGQNTARTGHQG